MLLVEAVRGEEFVGRAEIDRAQSLSPRMAEQLAQQPAGDAGASAAAIGGYEHLAQRTKPLTDVEERDRADDAFTGEREPKIASLVPIEAGDVPQVRLLVVGDGN